MAKRMILGPLAPLAHRWALSPPPTALKAKILRRVVVPAVVAAGKEYVRDVAAGFRFGGNATDLLELYVHLFGVWEPNLTAFLTNRLSAGDVFVDVGANSGWFTTLAATRVGPAGKVVAVEASPTIARRIGDNLRRNGLDNVRVVVSAAGREAGEVDVELGPAEHTGLTKVHRASGAVTAAARVPCDTLPNLLTADELATARVVKVDVEGGEFDVVAGLGARLRHFSDGCEFVVEVGPRRTASRGDVDDLIATFTGQGYTPYLLPNAYAIADYLFADVPAQLDRIDRTPSIETDIVFSRHDGPTLPL